MGEGRGGGGQGERESNKNLTETGNSAGKVSDLAPRVFRPTIIASARCKLGQGPSQPHLFLFCSYASVWLLYFIWSMSK